MWRVKRICRPTRRQGNVFAFGLRKKKDGRELFLTVEGDDFAFVVEFDPKRQAEARQFAAKINTAAKQ